jgi:predicted ATPase
MRQALATFEANSVEVEIPFYEAMLAEVLIAAGRIAEADSLLVDARARVERTLERWPLVEILRLEMACAAATGDRDAARCHLAEARAVCDEQAATTWAERLEADAHRLGLAAPAPHAVRGTSAMPGAA